MMRYFLKGTFYVLMYISVYHNRIICFRGHVNVQNDSLFSQGRLLSKFSIWHAHFFGTYGGTYLIMLFLGLLLKAISRYW
jgi:hypothetical protein